MKDPGKSMSWLLAVSLVGEEGPGISEASSASCASGVDITDVGEGIITGEVDFDVVGRGDVVVESKLNRFPLFAEILGAEEGGVDAKELLFGVCVVSSKEVGESGGGPGGKEVGSAFGLSDMVQVRL